ncbi:MAG TPA: TRAP transporter large permease subunit [Burkholderiales bacterium]|nr:TRAP transporter large permease subunit [Burkholderiales bacterium]
MRREMLFGFTIMALILIPVAIFSPWASFFDGNLSKADQGALGLIMLAMIVVAIMLGFPTAFTLMGMGTFFTWLAYRSVNPDSAFGLVLELMVQRAYGVMANDVLIAVPLFVFMGYLVERAQLIDRLFKSLHLALARVPGSLAVATIVTCAIFATATGIVGAVVTLMGLLALPQMLKARYNVQVAAGSITAGGCLGILIPPSVLLIVYGATAGVSVVQLYAGAFFPGFMLAALYVAYIVILAKLKPQYMPPLPEAERKVALPTYAQRLATRGRNAAAGLISAIGGAREGVPARTARAQLVVALLPLLFLGSLLFLTYRAVTAPPPQDVAAGLVALGGDAAVAGSESEGGGLIGAEEPSQEEAKSEEAQELSPPPAQEAEPAKPETVATAAEPEKPAPGATPAESRPAPTWFWIVLAIIAALLLLLFWLWTWERHEVFKMLLSSFFPLALLILAVLGSIVFGLATPAEAAAVGAFGGVLLTAAYRFVAHWRAARRGSVWRTTKELGAIVKESSFLTAKTSAMVCWLFVGSAIFSAAFALLGGQELVEKWVLSMDLTPLQFMLLAQFIIFVLGWPLEWTEIIVIFMPIFVPLLPHFNIDPLFFGLLVALNLQTAFLSPPVAMAAFYLKGVSPPHVTLNQIFGGMLPFMGIQVIAIAVLYVFPQIGLWLPSVLYGR